jgi:hypothetical protein
MKTAKQKAAKVSPPFIRAAELTQFDLYSLMKFYRVLSDSIEALLSLDDDNHPGADPMFSLVDSRLVVPLGKAQDACIRAIKAIEPKGRFDRERRAALLFHHAVYYDTPDKETISILTEALAAIASEPHSEGLEKSIQKAVEKAA